MKKFFVLIILFSVAITAFSQTDKIATTWLLTKAVSDDKIEEPYIVFEFHENGKMITMDMEVGDWKYDETENKIVMKSEFDKDFNGDCKIKKLNRKKLVLEKGNVTLYFSKIYPEKILTDNKNSKLSGDWKIQNSEDATIVLKIKLPDSYVLINSQDGVTETSKGNWMYNGRNESVIFIGLSRKIKGNNKITRISDNQIELENNGNIIKAIKQNASENKIERLLYEYSDFDEESNIESHLPWNDFYQMLEYLKNVESLNYNRGKLIAETNVFKNNTILSMVDVNIEEQIIEFTNLFLSVVDTSQYSQNIKGGLMEMYNDYFPKEELWPNKNLGNKIITVPAGTFECTVVQGFVGEEKFKYWMINEKPGVYARIINEKKSVFGDLEYFVFELKEIINK
jgi:hypothetical protein